VRNLAEKKAKEAGLKGKKLEEEVERQMKNEEERQQLISGAMAELGMCVCVCVCV
jgi:hypothetical protein